MKKIIYTIGVFLFALSSCNLESEMFDIINPNSYPQNEKDAEALVVGSAYKPFAASYQGIFSSAWPGIQVFTEMTTDIGYCQWNDVVWPPALEHKFTPNAKGLTEFYKYRADISRILNTFERIEPITMKEETKNRMKAELHLAAGWLAFLLYDIYGAIPIASLEDLKNPMGDIIIPRPQKEVTVSFIEENINKAIPSLPISYDKKDANHGRFTKGLAYTILMKLYMLEKNWEKAIEMGKILTQPEYDYSLVPRYKDIFTLENEKNSEIIWAVICGKATNMQMWQAHVLSSAYPTNNENIQKWGGYRVPWHFYDKFDPADQRLEVLIGEFTDKEGVLYNKENPGTVLIKGAMPVKYGEDPITTGSRSQIDFIVYRYADVLTLLAEALVRKDGAISQEAIDLLNKTRVRAGITSYQASDFASIEDFLDKVLLERGQELWFEGHRKSDLVRHGKYIEFARTYKGSTTTKDEFVLWPLPQSAIDEGKGKIIQNPGY